MGFVSWLLSRRCEGKKRLRAFSSCRANRFRQAVQAELVRLFKEADGSVDNVIHQQCLKDFDRADFIIGRQSFLQGAAALSGDVDGARAVFANCLRSELGSDGADVRFVKAVSALASQISMAHLCSVCFSGPHTYSFPQGCVTASYTIQRNSNVIRLSLARSADRITSFSLADGEFATVSPSSFARQCAEVVIRPASAGAQVESVYVHEALRLVWPNETVITHDGLALDLESPSKFDATLGRVLRGTAAVTCAPFRLLSMALGFVWRLPALLFQALVRKEHVA
mmetsp:Transcript_41341/g.81655  ORF Transcript_41341/g.81655 Transcript_41341/m.81655 type:complete len:283 (+) Transcript_41341:30-878(+)